MLLLLGLILGLLLDKSDVERVVGLDESGVRSGSHVLLAVWSSDLYELSVRWISRWWRVCGHDNVTTIMRLIVEMVLLAGV